MKAAWNVLRAEGTAAFCNRLLDRLVTWRRARSFRTVAVDDLTGPALETWPLTEVPVLNVLATPPRGDLGGVQVQLLRRLEAEAQQRPWALLYPVDGGYRLEVEADGSRRAVELRAEHAAVGGERDLTFERAVDHASCWVRAPAVHFEQLGSWPLASLEALRERDLELALSIHDFGLFCLRPHLLERPQMRFCNYSRDAARCLSCLRADWPVNEGFLDDRRIVAARLVRAAQAVIFPSDFLRRTSRELIGAACERDVVVEPPSARRSAAALPATHSRPIRHIAYVGSVKPHKGAGIFEEVVTRLSTQAPDLRWSVYGGGDADILRRLRRHAKVRGYYRADHLPEMLRRDEVDLALLLSIWPEAYALTYDECLRAGVPALAFDHGAIADRARRVGGCELLPLEDGADGVATRLRELVEGRKIEPARAVELPDAESAASQVLGIYRDCGWL